MRSQHGLVWVAAALLALPVAAADTESLAALFPLRAPISTDGPGLCRLELPVAVIGACRGDLADLRILDAEGRELPYVVDSPEPASSGTSVRYAAFPEILDAERSTDEVGDRVAVFRERYLLALPPLPADMPAWDLVLEAAPREFVRRVDVVAVGRGGERVPVVTGGSVFRLPSAGAERLRLTVPVRDALRLEVALAGEGQGYLEPRFTVEATRMLPEAGASRVPLDTVEVRQLAGLTEVVLDRPRGLVPRRLVIATSTGTFHRRVTVWDEGPGADPVPLGEGVVLRLAGAAPVEVLELPLRAPRGDRLRVVVENRDSPPLVDLHWAASMPRPALVFSLPDGAPAEAVLLFGGGRARRPIYDLADLDPGRARRAVLGSVVANPDYDPEPVLAFAMHPGAPVDRRRFEHRRRLLVAPSPEGLSRLRLEAADLAVLRPDLGDLRVVDDDGCQWAYLRQDRARPVATPLVVAGRERDGRVSAYPVELPAGAMAVERLEFEVDAPYFDRDFVLRGRLEDGSDHELVRGRLVRRAGDPRPCMVEVEPRRVVGLELQVADGDDAPLALVGVEAWSTAPDLYLAAPEGEYDLLLGDPGAEPPVYELERVRATVLAVPAAEITTGALEINPEFRAASRFAGSEGWQKILLWAVLGLAVVVLAAITLRAARS